MFKNYCASITHVSIDIDFIEENKYLYELFAIVNHTGSLNFGHYYSFINLKDQNKWLNFDDSKVFSIESVINNIDKAYILFYIRKDFDN